VTGSGPAERNGGGRLTGRWRWAEHFGAEVTYLNTASIGLPPRRTFEALGAVQNDWFTGRTQPGDFDSVIDGARAAYARLVHVDPTAVAVGSQVSPLVGLIAASVPDGSTVLVGARAVGRLLRGHVHA
jgi:selenocysteine lyase/cysteine desulfurase